jgi:hypothetical protein
MGGVMAAEEEAVLKVLVEEAKVASEAMAGRVMAAPSRVEAAEEGATMAPEELLINTGAVLTGALAVKPMEDAVGMVM